MKVVKYNEFIRESVSVKDHSYFIPSYEECRLICDAHDNFIFYEAKSIEDGYPVSIFNYRLAQYTNFVNPIPDMPDITSFEMRGLTFVFNEDGSLYKRYLLLDKFFNMDQTPCSMYSVVKDFKIKSIYNKEDGSIASFIRLPNGKVLGKSKCSFISDQALEIQRIYDETPQIQLFVNYCFDNNIDPVFEFVSPKNRIVVPYANADLILLRLRNNITGEYLDINDYSDKLDGISVVESTEGHTLDSIKDAVINMVGKEGVIVQFENGKMVKIKSPWYCSLHGLVTDKINRENEIIELVLSEQIDDVIAQIPENDERIDRIYSIVDIVSKEISLISHKVGELKSHYTGDRKNFAIKYHRNPYFSIVMGIVDGRDEIDLIKKDIRQDTSNLMMARKWVDERLS